MFKLSFTNFRLYLLAILVFIQSLSCRQDRKKVVVFWGDSLTASNIGKGLKGKVKKLLRGDRSYPGVFEDYLGKKEFQIVNCGVGGESTLTIMSRQGAFPAKLAHDVEIYVTKKSRFNKFLGNSDLIPFESSFNNVKITPLLQGGWDENSSSYFNPCFINGKPFVIKSESHYWKENKKYHFEFNYYLESINERFKSDTLRKGSIIETHGMRTLRNAYVNVFFMGQNGGFSNVLELIQQYKAMIKYSNCNRYIIIGFHKPNKSIPSIKRMVEMEDSLRNEFGDHYINLRSYMIQNGLKDGKLNPKLSDINSMRNGLIPPQLTSDGTHFTPTGSKLIGALVFKRFRQLGY